MPTYIALAKYTQQGIKTVREGPARLDTAKEAFRSVGAEIKETYLVMGHYDFVFVVEAPDDETVAKLALTVGSLGNIRTETLKAFTEDEYREIVAALPAS